MIFVLDNYDSFTYNLVQYMGELGAEMVIRRNDELSPVEVEAMKPDRIVISPGPCTPQDAGISMELIKHFARPGAPRRVPILGVCLGHQAIGAAFGGSVVRAAKLMHGKTMGQLFNAMATGTRDALREQGVQSLTLSTKALNEESVGALFMLLQLVVGSLGEALDINAFDQPGVELGKILARKILSS